MNFHGIADLKSHNHCTSGIASSKHKDLVYDLLEQHFGSLNNFVRNVSFDDSVSCVLFTDQQIYDIDRFCANTGSTNTSVLGVDPTFNLGEFYVTVTTYENLLLINRKTGKHVTSEDVTLLEKRKISIRSDTLSGRMKEVVQTLNTLPNDTVCLLPTRHMCNELNREVLRSLPGNEIRLLAIDTVDCPTYLHQKVSKKLEKCSDNSTVTAGLENVIKSRVQNNA